LRDRTLVRTEPDTLILPFVLAPLDTLHDFRSVAVDSSVVFDLGLVNSGRRYLFIDSTALEGDTAAFSFDFGRLGDLPYRISPSDTSFLAVTFHPVADTTFAAHLTLFFGDSQSVEVEFLGRGGGSGIEDCRLKIEDWGIGEVWPNPFNSTTMIQFTVGLESDATRLAVYDLQGRLVTDLLTGKMPIPRGEHRVDWDASGQSAGIYFARLEASGIVRTSKLVLVK
jgi:hypothetical protein